MPLRKTLLAVAVVVLVAGGAAAAVAWRPALDPVRRPAPESFDAGLVKRGGELAAIGNCRACHTAPGARDFAGGAGVPTPFGTIYSTNITPDEKTGIGTWSEAAFRRALREGVDRSGRHLYPAFPYDHFTLLADADIAALYGFLMTRAPVAATAPANTVRFPFNLRPLLAGWNLLFLRAGPYRVDPDRSAQWNRGAYLADGLAHCGACHTPRNVLGAEKKKDRFAGGEAEGWTAYALDRASPAPVPWDAAALTFYLRNGWHRDHGIARGPMSEVIDDLAAAPTADIEAIATYVAAVAGPASGKHRRTRDAHADSAGAAIYAAACATCHDAGRAPPYGGVDLSLSSGPSGPTARNVVNVVLWGLPATDEARRPVMPGFAGVLNDRQLADLAAYLRSRFSGEPPWTGVDQDVRAARAGASRVFPAPAVPGQQEARQ